jgi:AcrR family transcriptional regulator
MKGTETRGKIFQAAMRLADRDGLLTLTLDKVAAEAGLSKGGILHHFPTKDALLHGVIEYFAELVESSMTRLVAEDPNPSFRWIRAMLRLSQAADEPAEETSRDESPAEITPESLDRFMLSILAVAVHNPEVLKPIQAIGQRLRGRLTAVPEEGLEQLMMWLVFDGLFLWRFVGMVQPNDPLFQQVGAAIHARMEQLTAAAKTSANTKPRTKRGKTASATQPLLKVAPGS